jgi:hypothetical protein
MAAEAAQRRQQARQFDEQMSMRRQENDRAAAEREAAVADSKAARQQDIAFRRQESARTQANAEKQLGMQASGQAFNQAQTQRENAWGDVMKTQELKEREQRAAQYEETLAQFKTKAEEERRLLANRKSLAQSVSAAGYQATMENGGIAPVAVLNEMSKQLGVKFSGGFLDPATGDMHWRVVGPDGKEVDDVQPAATMQAYHKAIYGDEAAEPSRRRVAADSNDDDIALLKTFATLSEKAIGDPEQQKKFADAAERLATKLLGADAPEATGLRKLMGGETKAERPALPAMPVRAQAQQAQQQPSSTSVPEPKETRAPVRQPPARPEEWIRGAREWLANPPATATPEQINSVGKKLEELTGEKFAPVNRYKLTAEQVEKSKKMDQRLVRM